MEQGYKVAASTNEGDSAGGQGSGFQGGHEENIQGRGPAESWILFQDVLRSKAKQEMAPHYQSEASQQICFEKEFQNGNCQGCPKLAAAGHVGCHRGFAGRILPHRFVVKNNFFVL